MTHPAAKLFYAIAERRFAETLLEAVQYDG